MIFFEKTRALIVIKLDILNKKIQVNWVHNHPLLVVEFHGIGVHSKIFITKSPSKQFRVAQDNKYRFQILRVLRF